MGLSRRVRGSFLIRMKYYITSKLSENIHETPEGFLVCLGVPIARTGWQTYGDGETPLKVGDDGKVKVYRDPKEVFRPDTIASFQGKPLTIGHPDEFVNPSNWSDLSVGVLQNVRKSPDKGEDGEECLLSDVLVTDAKAIELIKAGLREVSCGYEAVYEQTGEGEGRQVEIIGNHLALVEEGRAGPSYAINDSKNERSNKMSKFSEKLKQMFSKVVDEAEQEEKKEGAKDGESKPEPGKPAAYDELVKMVKDLSDKVGAMGQNKDEAPKKEDKPMDEKEEPKKEDKASDADPMAALEERLKTLEEKLAKLMGSQDADESEDDGEDDEEDDSDKSEDEKEKVGDTAYRAEILSPGIKVTKDVKSQALKAAYATKEGKQVIDALSGGKTPTFDSKSVDALFISASEVLKVTRGNGLQKTRDSHNFQVGDSKSEPVTAEKMNELNKAFWAQK